MRTLGAMPSLFQKSSSWSLLSLTFLSLLIFSSNAYAGKPFSDEMTCWKAITSAHSHIGIDDLQKIDTRFLSVHINNVAFQPASGNLGSNEIVILRADGIFRGSFPKEAGEDRFKDPTYRISGIPSADMGVVLRRSSSKDDVFHELVSLKFVPNKTKIPEVKVTQVNDENLHALLLKDFANEINSVVSYELNLSKKMKLFNSLNQSCSALVQKDRSNQNHSVNLIASNIELKKALAKLHSGQDSVRAIASVEHVRID